MMTRFGAWTLTAAVAIVLSLTGPARAENPAGLVDLVEPATKSLPNTADAAETIQGAAPNTTFLLEEGTYKLGNIKGPANTQFIGKGYDKTIIDATGFEHGFMLSNGCAITDVTIRNATGAGVVVNGADDVHRNGGALVNVAILGCPAGVTVTKATGFHVRNLIIADAQSGVSFVDCTHSALVNVTLADIAGTAIGVSGCDKMTIFNNLIAGAAFGIVLGEGNKNLAIDHNIYNANFVGRMPGHTARKKMEAWYHLSGFDRHSQTIGVEFKDAANHDYRVVSPLSWSPTRATTAYMGAVRFNGDEANPIGIDGKEFDRSRGVDIGAFQTSFDAPRKADGTFEVKSGAGVTSAGLFTTDGVCVRYLFQNTPLPKGTYEYWLPSRDWQGREIKPGDYELRITESALSLRYIAAAGNGDLETSKKLPASTAVRYSLDPQAAAFIADGRIVFAQSGFESQEHIRLFSADMGEIPWSMTGGGHAVGVAVDDAKKLAYVLRQPEVPAGQPGRPCSLLRFEVDTGKPAPFKSGSFEKSFDAITGATSMTLLGGKMYIAEPAANKIHELTISDDDVEIAGESEIASPTQIAGDDTIGVLWIVSENKQLVGLGYDETKWSQPSAAVVPMEQLTAVAANNGRVAVYSAKDNKVTIFGNFTFKSAELKALRTIGTGGEGYGKIQGDKFWNPSRLALGRDGQLLVIDAPRTMLFDKDGKLVRQMLGMWGQGIGWGMFAGDDRAHYFNINGGYDILFDAKKQAWEPGTRWTYTMGQNTPNFVYAAGGKTFAVYQAFENKKPPYYLYVSRMEKDTGTARVVSRYGFEPAGLYRQLADADGIVPDDAEKERLVDGDGKPIVWNFFQERGAFQMDYQADGSIVIAQRKFVQIIPMTGLDANGVPVYDFTKMRLIQGLVDGQTTFASPYDFTTIDDVSIAEDMTLFEDGTFTACMSTKSGPGPDLASEHGNTTNMAGFDAAGNLRWFSPLNPFGLKMGFQGVVTVADITFVGRGAICEWETMDRDGLGTGTLGTPADMGWRGMWLDNHRQTQPLIGNDGKPYLVVGDYAAQCYHWLAVDGYDKITRQRVPVKVNDGLAAALAKQPAKPVPHYPVPQPPKFVIKNIGKDLPMDGDLAKWRTLGIKPLVVAPDQTVKNDPRDTSAIIRMAHNGDKLFVQVIKFDDVITFHQRNIWAHYLHDGIEMCVNIFYNGWKYNVTRIDGQDVVYRDRMFAKESDFLTEEVSPRKITVLDNARDVEERKMLEASRGVDMSGCKVMIVEFTLTQPAIDGMLGGSQMEFGSGKSFLVGFSINDGDVPGADTMNLITWPVMYGTFSRAEAFATATFE